MRPHPCRPSSSLPSSAAISASGPSVRFVLVAALALGLASPPSRPAAAGDESAPRPEKATDDAATARALAPSFVRVELTLRHDQGEPPTTLAGRGDYSSYITQERPVEVTGLLLAPDRVLVVDPEMHPRFVSKIEVVAGAARTGATVASMLTEVDGVILALEAPLAGARPLSFQPDRPGPYRAVYYGQESGAWTTIVGPTLEQTVVDQDGQTRKSAWVFAVVVDREDVPIGVTLAERVRADGRDWRGSPLTWPQVDHAGFEAERAATASTVDHGLLRVHLRLRSPKADGSRSFGRSSRDAETETERNAVGLVAGPRQVIVLTTMDVTATSRLETIDLHLPDGTTVRARFVASYRHYGALLVEPAQDLPRPLRVAAGPLRDRRGTLLYDAHLVLHGERRRLYVSQTRIGSVRQDWRRQWVVALWDGADGHFLFDREGALVAFPIERRLGEERSRWNNPRKVLLSSEYLAALVEDAAAHADPANVPVVAEAEDRLAWLGVETQDLNRDLARANGVSTFTQDGSTGALVSYVYDGSPAQRAGLKPGDVLLRLHSPDRPAPISIGGSDDRGGFSFSSFFSEMGDDWEGMAHVVSGQTPWPSVDSPLHRTLTKLGVGKPVRLEYAVDGEVRFADLVIEEGPPHFGSAPLWKSVPLGVTVRDLTYEVRRHYQLGPDVLGVVVSKVERGGRAAVAGLRALDLVLKVGDRAIPDVATFRSAVEAGGALRLTVKDRLKERVVQIAAAAPGPDGDGPDPRLPGPGADDEEDVPYDDEDDDG